LYEKFFRAAKDSNWLFLWYSLVLPEALYKGMSTTAYYVQLILHVNSTCQKVI